MWSECREGLLHLKMTDLVAEAIASGSDANRRGRGVPRVAGVWSSLITDSLLIGLLPLRHR